MIVYFVCNVEFGLKELLFYTVDQPLVHSLCLDAVPEEYMLEVSLVQALSTLQPAEGEGIEIRYSGLDVEDCLRRTSYGRRIRFVQWLSQRHPVQFIPVGVSDLPAWPRPVDYRIDCGLTRQAFTWDNHLDRHSTCGFQPSEGQVDLYALHLSALLRLMARAYMTGAEVIGVMDWRLEAVKAAFPDVSAFLLSHFKVHYREPIPGVDC